MRPSLRDGGAALLAALAVGMSYWMGLANLAGADLPEVVAIALGAVAAAAGAAVLADARRATS